MRRLTRSRLGESPVVVGPSRLSDIDCSRFFPPDVDGGVIHGLDFVTDETLNLMCCVLRGLDRDVVDVL